MMNEEERAHWIGIVHPSRHHDLDVLFEARTRGLITEQVFGDQALRLAMTPQDSTADIARHLLQASRQQLEPWRVDFDAAVAQWDLAMERAAKPQTDDLMHQARTQFVVKAKARSLSVEEAMFGSYICIMDDGEAVRAMLYHLLFEVSASVRIQRHNQYMLNQYQELERSAIATRVAKLRVPLFPPFGDLKAINETLLADTALLGGGRDSERRVSPNAVAHYFRQTEVLTGGDYYEPVLDAEGRQLSTIHMVGTDARLNQLHAELASLRAELAASSVPSGGRGRGAGSYGRGRGGRGAVGATAYQNASVQRQTQIARKQNGGYNGAGWPEESPKNE